MIGINYTLEIEVLTPVHIGSGTVLKRNVDFVEQNGVTYVLNEQHVLDEFWTDDPRQQDLVMSQLPGQLVRDMDLQRRPELVQRAHRGMPQLGELREHIGDVFGQAYIPGSSLKGALRTALLRTVLEGVKRRVLTRQDIGTPMNDVRDARAAKSAASGLERQLTGINPNYDVFRGVQISDTQAVAGALAMCNVLVAAPTVNSPGGAAVSVEILKPGTKLSATLKLDQFVLQTMATALNLDSNVVKTVKTFVRAARFTVDDRARKEFAYHKARQDTQAAQFYSSVSNDIAALNQQKEANTFYLQVGYAGGWRSKTLLGGLSDDEANPESALLAQVVNDFYLNRGGKAELPPEMVAGQFFPKLRHLMLNAQGGPSVPLGWLKVKSVRR